MALPQTPEGRAAAAEAITRDILMERALDRMLALNNTSVGLSFKELLRAMAYAAIDETLAAGASAAQDAARWRALLASQRMHFMGCAGFELQPEDEKTRDNLTPVPMPGTYMHFGMEFWSEHPAHGDPRYPDNFERRLLTAYVDEIIKRAAAKGTD